MPTSITQPHESLAQDLLSGAREIAAYLGESQRAVEYKLERRQLPAFQIGTRWYMRRSTFLKHIASKEIAVS
jgi:hypothetical protein